MALLLSHITKRFGTVAALDDVSFDVQPGEIHALVGENGAGKTTLMRIAYGMIQPDQGEVLLAPDKPFRPTSPADARSAGIGMVHQHFTSIAALSVGENIALSAGWPESGKRAEQRASELMARLELPIEAGMLAGELSAQLRQRLEVVKALAADAQTLLLDEPSAVLAPREVQELLREVRAFAARGGAVALITHKLDEVFAAAHRVTVLRRGRVVESTPVSATTPQALARAMIGEALPLSPAPARSPGEVMVRAERFCLASKGRPAVVDAEFVVRTGEIVGVAAIEGNGQRELLRAVAGVAGAERLSGTLEVMTPVAFIPEDRSSEGIIPDFSLTENVVLGTLAREGRWIDWDAAAERTGHLLEEFDVRATGPAVAAGTLSGGNQQKLLLARAVDLAPRVLVAENPTRGLDIRATEAIHQRLRSVAASGVAVMIHSSDLDEVLALADRMLVMAGGRLTECAVGAGRDAVGDAMLGLVGTG